MPRYSFLIIASMYFANAYAASMITLHRLETDDEYAENLRSGFRAR